ncbi:MAG: hypothetical protein HUJ98_01470, partial [Bacteroidaceae bacterium]|nr:hypothetical protein [Bacteroidaceae bacterium]
MKKLFTLVLLVLMASSAITSQAAMPGQKAAINGALKGINPAMLDKINASSMRAAAKAEGEETPITNPEGEVKYYNRSTEGYIVVDYERVWEKGEYGAKVVYGENNEVYIDNPVPGLPFGAYLKATIEGNKITAKLPQLVGLYDYYGTILYYYVSKMKSDPTQIYVPVEDEADNVVTWTVKEDGSFSLDLDPGEIEIDPETGRPVTDPEYVLGMYMLFGESINFSNTADCKQEFTPVDVESRTAHAPEGLAFEPWSLTASEGMAPRFVNVGIAGNNIYISNLTDDAPEAVIKGSIEDGKAIFPTCQFLNYLTDYSYFVYFMSAKVEEGEEYSDFVLNNGLAFDYDAENKTLTSKADDVMLINASDSKVYWIDYALQPVINWVNPEDLNAAPNDPELTYFGEDYGCYYTAWEIPATNVKGKALDPDRMYYNIFMDGELYTFYTDMYSYFPEDITDMPYKFTENYDIVLDGSYHGIYIYDGGFKTLGIQSHFKGFDGKIYSSAIKTFDVGSGVESVEESKEVKKMEYFDFTGAKIERPAQGLYIQRATYT